MPRSNNRCSTASAAVPNNFLPGDEAARHPAAGVAAVGPAGRGDRSQRARSVRGEDAAGAASVLLDDSGHMSLMEQPDAVAAAVIALIERGHAAMKTTHADSLAAAVARRCCVPVGMQARRSAGRRSARRAAGRQRTGRRTTRRKQFEAAVRAAELGAGASAGRRAAGAISRQPRPAQRVRPQLDAVKAKSEAAREQSRTAALWSYQTRAGARAARSCRRRSMRRTTSMSTAAARSRCD